jgi:hypothetical protein
MSDEMGLVARLKVDAEYLGRRAGSSPVIAKDCAEAAAAIERLVAESDEARAEVERLTPLAVAYDYLESPARADIAEAQRDKLKEALAELVNAKAISGVREVVAGWNGENRPDGPYDRHPPRLGATLPKTDCGSVYELDEAMQRARQALGDT